MPVPLLQVVTPTLQEKKTREIFSKFGSCLLCNSFVTRSVELKSSDNSCWFFSGVHWCHLEGFTLMDEEMHLIMAGLVQQTGGNHACTMKGCEPTRVWFSPAPCELGSPGSATITAKNNVAAHQSGRLVFFSVFLFADKSFAPLCNVTLSRGAATLTPTQHCVCVCVCESHIQSV